MKLRHNPETGKLLFEMENHEPLNSLPDATEELMLELVSVISDSIGPDVALLKNNQERLISICRQQQATIVSMGKTINCLVINSQESSKYQMEVIDKINKDMEAEFRKLQKLLGGD